AGRGAVTGEGFGEAAVVLVALAGQALHRRLGLGRFETAGHQPAGQVAAGVLPPHQQAQATRVGIGAVPPPAAGHRPPLQPPRPRAIRNRGPPAGGSGRGGSTPAAPAGPGHAGRDRCCPAPGRRPRPAPQSAAASAASSPITRPGTNFSRSLASRSLATAGLSLSHWRAFSLPWPMRSPL